MEVSINKQDCLKLYNRWAERIDDELLPKNTVDILDLIVWDHPDIIQYSKKDALQLSRDEYYIIPIPFDKNGRGPCKTEDCVGISWHIWDHATIHCWTFETQKEAEACFRLYDYDKKYGNEVFDVRDYNMCYGHADELECPF